MCTHSFLETDYGTKVCVNCGIEHSGPIRPRYHDVGDKAPLYISTYSRHKRFYNFLQCVVDPVFATHPPHKTIAMLMEDKPFSNLQELLAELKKKDTHQKSYSHFHYYARRFVVGYTEPRKLTRVQINNIMSFFAKVENCFECAELSTSFFSYPWLCRKLLLKFGHERFVSYIKTIICKKRIAKYEELWQSLGLDVVLKQFRVRLKRFNDTFTNGGTVRANRSVLSDPLLQKL